MLHLGLNRFISDVRFMLNVKLGLYWKLTLGYIIPVIMLLILVASLIDYKPLQQGDYLYPATAIGSNSLIDHSLFNSVIRQGYLLSPPN